MPYEPKGYKIGRGETTEKLYELERQRTDIIIEAAKEHGRLLGFAKEDFWTHALPEQLLSLLDSFQTSSSLAAAKAFIAKHSDSDMIDIP